MIARLRMDETLEGVEWNHVRVLELGHFCVFPLLDGAYNLTHIYSGYRAAQLSSKEKAIALARKLNELPDNDQT